MERRIQKRSIRRDWLLPDCNRRLLTRIDKRSAVMAEESLNAEIAQVKLSDLFLRREWVPAQQSPLILTGMMAGIFS